MKLPLPRKNSNGKIIAVLYFIFSPVFLRAAAVPLWDFFEPYRDAKSHAVGTPLSFSCRNPAVLTQNPSLLCYASKTLTAVNLNLQPAGLKTVQAGFIKKGLEIPMGLNVSNTLYPEEERRDAEGNLLGTFRNSESALSFSTALGLKKWTFGVSGTAVLKKLSTRTSPALALSVSGQYPLLPRLQIAGALRNATLIPFKWEGPEERFNAIVVLGTCVKVLESENWSLEVSSEFFPDPDENLRGKYGMEWALNGIFFVRGGIYPAAREAQAGAGINFKKILIDWSIRTGVLDPRESTHFSVGWEW